MSAAGTSGRRSLGILAVLVAFGAAEVAVALSGGNPATTTFVLVVLASAQTAFFALFSMHLVDETHWLRRIVAAPLLIAAVYGVLLVADSVWRHKP